MRFELTPDLLAQLRRYSDEQRRQYPGWGGEEDELGAFLLHPGMGPLIFITIDGRILIDERAWHGDVLREAADDDEAIESLVIGASMTGIAALLALVPAPPPGASTCRECAGSRWIVHRHFDREHELVCHACHGRGWSAPSG